MGEMADWMIDQEINKHLGAEECCPTIGGNDQWPTSDGRVVSISSMNEGHLINAIAKVKRDSWRLEFLPLLEAELNKRRKRQTAGKK